MRLEMEKDRNLGYSEEREKCWLGGTWCYLPRNLASLREDRGKIRSKQSHQSPRFIRGTLAVVEIAEAIALYNDILCTLFLLNAASQRWNYAAAFIL